MAETAVKEVKEVKEVEKPKAVPEALPEFDLADLKAVDEGGSSFLSILSGVEYLPQLPIDEFPSHTFAAHLPMMRPEEMGALEASIKEVGIKDPVVLWQDSKGRRWVLDGRNRVAVFRKLIEEAFVMPDGKLPQIPVQWFLGDDKQAFEYARRNLDRRQLEPGQRAATAVLMDEAYGKIVKGKKVKGAKTSTPEETAEIRAMMAGCSRGYYFDCIKLLARRDLLLEVRDGKKSVRNAVTEMKKANEAAVLAASEAQARKDAGEDGAEVATTTAEPEPEKAKIVYDGERTEVPDDWHPVFLIRDKVKPMAAQINAIIKEFTAMAETSGGKLFKAQEAIKCLEDFRKNIVDNQPHVICANCDGSGRKDRKPCEACMGHGFVSKPLVKAWKRRQEEEARIAKRKTEHPRDKAEENGEAPEEDVRHERDEDVPEDLPHGEEN